MHGAVTSSFGIPRRNLSLSFRADRKIFSAWFDFAGFMWQCLSCNAQRLSSINFPAIEGRKSLG